MDEKSNKQIESIVGSFFYGEIAEPAAFPFPYMGDGEKSMGKEIVQSVSKFCKDNIDSAKFDDAAAIPKEVLQGLADLGLCGLAVPEAYGGFQLDYSLYCRVFAEIAGNDGSVATTLGAHQSIGYRALLIYGTDAQKSKWLPKLASGEVMAAFCLTEPGSGSDAYSIKTKAVKNKDGSFTLTGQKLWITNGGLAKFYSVFCKTDHEVDGQKTEKISCFLVEGDRPGVSFGEKENKMGIRASETRAVYFDKVNLPADNIIGEAGKGFKIAMNVLNSGRLSLGAGCVGGMKQVLALATAQASNRKQFGKNISEFGLIQEKLARMAAYTFATESLIYMTTGNISKGLKDFSLESAVCKIYGSEALWQVVDMAMQIAAGSGYMKEYPYERIMRDSRINMIFEGTNEILRCFIALNGVRGPSEKLKELGKIADISHAINDPIKSLGVLTDFAKKRISHMMANQALTKCHPLLEEQGKYFSGLVSKFAIEVENVLMKYGKDIVDHELSQKRLADMAISLFVTISVLSRASHILDDAAVPQERKDYVLCLAKIICRDARKDIVSNLKGMKKNYDRSIKNASAAVVNNGGYGLDILDY